MIIFTNIDKIIFINTTVINRSICYMASFPTNELNHLFTTYSTNVGNRWDGRETARRRQQETGPQAGLRARLQAGPRAGSQAGC